MRAAHLKLLFASLLFIASLVFVRQASAITIDQEGNVYIFRGGEVLSSGSGNGDDEGGSSGSGSSGSNGSGSSGSGLSGSSDDDDDDSSGSGSSSSGSSGSGSPGSDDDNDKDDSSSGSGSSGSKKTRTTTSGGIQIRTEEKDEEVRTETRLPSGIKIKTREEEGKVRTDIYQGGQKLRLERRADRVVVKIENEAGEEGEEVEIPGVEQEEEILKIEQRPGQVVRVQTLENRFVVSAGQVGARTDFPISVNLQTNELVINTPAGEKTVAVLPDQAVESMRAANIIDQIRGFAFTQAVREATTAATLEEIVSLVTTRDGVLAYEIPGLKNERFLGFINVQIAKTAVVSAESGTLLEVQQSLFSTALDLLSF